MSTISVKDASGASVPIQAPNANGQAAMAGSRPVVIASDQSAVPVSAAGLPLPTGAATEATLEALNTKTPALGARLDDVASAPVVLSNQDLAQLAAIVTAVNSVTSAVNAGGVTPGTAGTPATDVLTVQGSGVSGSPILIHARQGTGSIYSGDTAITPKFKAVAASASGATTVVAAVTGKKIRVLGFYLVGNGAVNTNFQSHTTTSTAAGLNYIAAAGGGVSVGYSPLGWFETVAGEALDINLSAAIAVGGQIIYIEV